MGVRQVLQMTGVEFETMDFIPNMLFAEFKLLILLNTLFCISLRSYRCKMFQNSLPFVTRHQWHRTVQSCWRELQGPEAPHINDRWVWRCAFHLFFFFKICCRGQIKSDFYLNGAAALRATSYRRRWFQSTISPLKHKALWCVSASFISLPFLSLC